MTLSLIHGNALTIPLADQSVHLIATSPPYFALRSYRDGDEHVDGQLGSEETPHHFLAALWAVMDECWRVLRDDGSCWVNLGDKFSGYTNGAAKGRNVGGGERSPARVPDGPVSAPTVYGVRNKSRMLVPGRFALGLIDPSYRVAVEREAGAIPLGVVARPGDRPRWVCRMDPVWSKPNWLPEPRVSDRVEASHEQWFHLTKSARYFADRRVVKELGGSVWEVPVERFRPPAGMTEHNAAFPSEFPRRIVLGWSPRGGRVLDPFSGTGTTPVVAAALGRHGIGVDLSWDYSHQIARWRDEDGTLCAKAQGRKPPKKVKTRPSDGTPGSLFDLLDV